MEQSKPDVWTLGTTTAITSTFDLLLIEGRSRSIDAEPFSSRRCGLGWEYNIQATNADATQLFSGGTESGKRTMFKISFAAPSIMTTNLDKLFLAVSTSDKPNPGAGVRTGTSAFTKTTVHVSDISLPVSQSIPFASIQSIPNFTGSIIVQIRVEIRGSLNFEHAFRPRGPPNLNLHTAVAQTLSGKAFDDVKFGLFTRRGGDDVTDPSVLFVNRSLSHGHNAFLLELLSEDNMERELVAFGDLAAQRYSAYDYMSDSDLEPDNELNTDDCIDLDSPASSLWGEEGIIRPKKDQTLHRNLDKDEKIIFIRDTAFETWKALVFYLYTKEIHFKPLRSTGSRNVEASGHDIACSPKSMYRLAQKIGLQELQVLSLEAIIQDLSENNIIVELFSHFTSMYPDIQEAEVKVLIPLLKKPEVFKSLLSKMDDVVTGGLPHCGAIVKAIVGHVGELAIVQVR